MDESTETNINRTAILFGNIDKKGQLETDDHDFDSLNKLENFQLDELNDTIKVLLNNSEDLASNDNLQGGTVTPRENIVAQDFYDESEVIDDESFENLVDTNKLDKNRYDESYDDDDDECVIVDDSSVKMPPPTEFPSIFQTNRRNPAEALINLESQLERTNGSNIDQIKPGETFVNNLTTPLASILPPEYANVDITTMFPHFHPDKIPRWSKLFKAFHEPQLYRPLDVIKSTKQTVENGLVTHPVHDSENNQNTNPLCYYNDFGLNMGEEPPPNMILPNEAELFSQPAKTFSDCEVPVPFRDMNINSINHNNQHIHLDSAKNNQNNFINPQLNNNNNSNNSNVNYINNATATSGNTLNGSTQSSYQRKVKLQQESLLARRKRKREEKYNKRNGDSEITKRDELLTGLTWTDGPAKYWYDLFEIPLSANIIDYEIEPNLHLDGAEVLPVIEIEPQDEDCKFFSWQLFHWENDIIVDPTNFKKEVLETNRKYAPYAGWIPSYKHRNMSTFQDAFSADYFGIWPSSSTGTTLQRPTSSQWRSIFAPENPQIMDVENWAKQIITDPRQSHAQQPYLLELDLNNEHIHFDFTNPIQTMEILTSELNDVFLSLNQPSGASGNAVSSTSGFGSSTGLNNMSNQQYSSLTNDSNFSQLDANDSMQPPNQNTSNTDNLKDEKQIKKMKILSKFSESTEQEEKPKEEKLEIVEDDGTVKLHLFSDMDTYQLLPDVPDKNSLFYLDPIDGLGESGNPANANSTLGGGGNSITGPSGTGQTGLTGGMGSTGVAGAGASGNTNNTNANTVDLINCPELASPLIAQGIQHSLSAIKLHPFLFPLKIDNQFLRYFHRPRLSDIKHLLDPLIGAPTPIYNLKDVLKVEDEQRQKISQLTGNGDLFFMRSVNDLSSCVDHLIFAEYSEEYPPLVNQTGMASRIVNYYCGNPKQPVIMPQLKYGEMNITQQIPFLGQIQPHQIFRALENNMFRSPIYSHRMRPTDFLVMMKSSSIYIRRVDDIFTVGQQLPLIEVPAPNSKKANTFLKDFLQVQIIRQFLQSDTEPKKIRHDILKTMFTEQSDSALKKRLKVYAEYKKAEVGNGTGHWVLKPEFQLPSEDELLECITPEECCCYYSMMWGLCRLEDAGYNSRTLTQAEPDQQDDDDDKDSNLKIEDEVKAAPWHTTKAFLDAQKGKCYLELNGTTDPTGIGEGFSYARVSTKASLFKETLKTKGSGSVGGKLGISGSGLMLSGNSGNNVLGGVGSGGTSGTLVPGVGKRMVTGTDADLRKLTLKEAYALLQKNGIPEHSIRKMKRWDIIDLVREMSTQKAKQGEEEGMTKFARSSRLTSADQEGRYRAECQRIFQLQNRVLANDDELTSDDAASDEDEDGAGNANSNNIGGTNDDLIGVSAGGDGQDAELMKVKKTFETTAAERRAAAAAAAATEMMETNSVADGGDNSNSAFPTQATSQTPRSNVFSASRENARAILKMKPPVLSKQIPKALCIRRYLDSGDGSGTKIMQPQTIPWSYIVKIYFKMNEEHRSEYLKDFCGLLSQSKEEEKKVRKKQQEQLRRIKRQQKQKLQMSGAGEASSNIKKKYSKTKLASSNNSKTKLTNSSQHQQQGGEGTSTGGSLVANISCGACGNKGHMRTNKECPLYGKLPATGLKKRTQKRASQNSNTNGNAASSTTTIQELLTSAAAKSSDAGGVDQVDGGGNVEGTNGLNSCVGVDETGNPNVAGTDTEDSTALKLFIPKNLIPQCGGNSSGATGENKGKVKSKKSELPGANKKSGTNTSGAAGGSTSSSANVQLNPAYIAATMKQNEYILEQKMKGNRRRINPTVALNHQFEEIYRGFLQIPGYRCFLHPVKKRECPTYYDIIENPMDLSTVKMRINDNYYQTRESFIQDIKLIYENCIKFNGDSHEYSAVAGQLISHVMEQFCIKERKLMRLERLVNPLMDEDDMVGMRFILEQAVSAMEEVEYSRPFHCPVDKKRYPDYMDKIPGRPMDLETLRANIKQDRYRSRDEFLADAEIIVTNCAAYNGQNSSLTTVASRMIIRALDKFAENGSALHSLETNLKMQMDEDASDSQVAGSSCMTDHLSHIGEDNYQEGVGVALTAVGAAEDEESVQITAPGNENVNVSTITLVEDQQQEDISDNITLSINAINNQDVTSNNSGLDITADSDAAPGVSGYDDIYDSVSPSVKRPRMSIEENGGSIVVPSVEANSGIATIDSFNEKESCVSLPMRPSNQHSSSSGGGGGGGGGGMFDSSRERLMADLHLTDSEGSEEDDVDIVGSSTAVTLAQQEQLDPLTSCESERDVNTTNIPFSHSPVGKQNDQISYDIHKTTGIQSPPDSNVKFYISDDE